MSNVTLFPGQPQPDDAIDDGAFSADQIETLAVALAGLKEEFDDTLGDRIAAARSIAKVELEARLSGAEDAAKTELHAVLAEKFAGLKDTVNREFGLALAGAKTELGDAFGDRLKTALATVKIELDARLSGSEDTVRIELHASLEKRFAKLRDTVEDALRTGFERKLAGAIEAFRQETDLTLGAIRSELLAKFDDKSFGLMLTDIDPRMLERSLRELKTRLEQRLETIGTRVGETSKRIDARVDRDVGELRKLVEALQGRISSGDRLAGRRAEDAKIKDWRVDVENYSAAPVMRDGSLGPPVNLRPMFERFFEEVKS